MDDYSDSGKSFKMRLVIWRGDSFFTISYPRLAETKEGVGKVDTTVFFFDRRKFFTPKTILKISVDKDAHLINNKSLEFSRAVR